MTKAVTLPASEMASLRPCRIVVLNIRAGGGSRTDALCRFLEAHDPDVAVLTEWRDNPSGQAFIRWAAGRGMRSETLSDGATPNGTMLAVRQPAHVESLTGGRDCPGVLMLARFFGWTMLACYFPQGKAKAAFFEAAVKTAALYRSVPFLLVGDLNTGNQAIDKDKVGGAYFCAPMFDALSEHAGLIDLWRRTNGPNQREWTWLSHAKNGFRIDHAFGNRSYVRQMQPICRYDHSPRLTGISDHSGVLIKAARKAGPGAAI